MLSICRRVLRRHLCGPGGRSPTGPKELEICLGRFAAGDLTDELGLVAIEFLVLQELTGDVLDGRPVLLDQRGGLGAKPAPRRMGRHPGASEVVISLFVIAECSDAGRVLRIGSKADLRG